jgi:adenine C2-methylase RlmN of 23S rRNA A2503 and tRNA A37
LKHSEGIVIPLERLGQARYRAAQLCAWIYEHRAKRFEEMSNSVKLIVDAELLEKLQAGYKKLHGSTGKVS